MFVLLVWPLKLCAFQHVFGGCQTWDLEVYLFPLFMCIPCNELGPRYYSPLSTTRPSHTLSPWEHCGPKILELVIIFILFALHGGGRAHYI